MLIHLNNSITVQEIPLLNICRLTIHVRRSPVLFQCRTKVVVVSVLHALIGHKLLPFVSYFDCCQLLYFPKLIN